MKLSDNINTLARFLGRRDIERLERACLREHYGIDQADVMVLFGGSILAGGDLLAQAIKEKIAKKYLIVGGAGHTTETLRQQVRAEHPFIDTDGRPEAEIFQRYLQEVYDCEADYLEKRSTNCGNNITYMLDLLEEEGIPHGSIILCQDATMQARMDAGLRKYAPDTFIINYAAYKAEVIEVANGLAYREPIHGMWDMERYILLLMGEIPRLTDDENGYGPRGRDYIAHVDVPEEVRQAFEEVKRVYGAKIVRREI